MATQGVGVYALAGCWVPLRDEVIVSAFAAGTEAFMLVRVVQNCGETQR